MKKRHPMQPAIWDGQGVIRFQANPIVRFLLDWARTHGMTLNDLAALSQGQGRSKDDWAHFAQLHGYSVSGWGSLSYVTNKHWERAKAKEALLREKCPIDPANAVTPTLSADDAG